MGWEYYADIMWVFTLGYYIWRALLICVILRRREFYKVKYEMGIAITAISISIIVFYSFLVKTVSIFIRADELREELGFAIIVAIYGFIKFILDKKVTQRDVLKETDLERHIVRKFEKFFKRYRKIIDINDKNNKIWIILFAIMIFEDFNRGPEKRAVEYILLPVRKKESLGIMQVETNKFISSKESIKIAFNMIQDYLEELDDYITEYVVYERAIRYNKDERYGENVSYIYNVLERYIYENKYYKSVFCLNEKQEIEEQPVEIFCNTLRELAEKLEENKIYSLNKQTTDILEGLIDTKYLQVEQAGDGWEVVFKGLANVKIKGNESHLFSHFKEASVIRFENCIDIEICDFKLGHNVGSDECYGPVVDIINSYNIVLRNVEFYGCGTYGVYASESVVILQNANIHI